MIKIRLFLDGSPKGYEVSGHSGYDKSGRDIVCAGVSSVAQTAYLGLIDVVGITPTVVIDDKKGYLKVTVPSGLTEKQTIETDAILGTMRVGLKELATGYSTYVKLEEN